MRDWFDRFHGMTAATFCVLVLFAILATSAAKLASLEPPYHTTIPLSGTADDLDAAWQRERGDLQRILKDGGHKPGKLTVTWEAAKP